MGQRHRVGVLGFDGVKLLDVAGPSEVFSEANRFGAAYGLALGSATGRDVTSPTGMRIAVDARAGPGHHPLAARAGPGPGLPGDRGRARRDAGGVPPASRRPVAVLAVAAGAAVAHRAAAETPRRSGRRSGRRLELIRFGTAKDLLDAGSSVTDTAFRSGFGSSESLRRAFIQRLGISPRAYQQRFRSAIRT